MSVLLLAEVTDSGLSLDMTSRAVTAARQLGEITLLCIGSNLDQAVQHASEIEGLNKILVADHCSLEHNLAEPTANLITKLANEYSHIVAPASSNAKNILPRVAALLDVMIINDVISIESSDTFRRPIYAGNAIQTVKSNDSIKILTVRTSVYEPTGTTKSIKSETIEVPEFQSLSSWIENKVEVSSGPELTSAKIVVSAGRAIGSVENFKIIQNLANKLDAAVGASRAAVDAGYAPNDWQVGQTGKVVAPNLYIACGISGAIQHLAGMKDSKVIVAINTDPDAPIFQVADFGIVGDLFEIIPQFTEQLS